MEIVTALYRSNSTPFCLGTSTERLKPKDFLNLFVPLSFCVQTGNVLCFSHWDVELQLTVKKNPNHTTITQQRILPKIQHH